MKKNIIALFLLLSFICFQGQNKVNFSYDKSGNRISRTITMSPKSIVGLPDVFTEQLSERIIKIYPNPTKGLLNIEIEKFEEQSVGTIIIFDLQGKVVKNKKIDTNTTSIDIADRPAGIYILKIGIDGEYSNWKIIKE